MKVIGTVELTLDIQEVHIPDTNIRQSNMHMVACGIIYHQNWESAHH